MNKEQRCFGFFRVKLFLILIPLFSFNPEIFSLPGNGFVSNNNQEVTISNADTVICGNQVNDTLRRLARFDYSENGSDFYYVKLSLFPSEFERLYFYWKSREVGMYMANKDEFYNDSTLFITSFNKEQAWLEFQELFQSTASAGLSTSETDKREFVKSSPFRTDTHSQQFSGINSPFAGEIPCSTASVSCSANIYSFPSGTSGTAPPVVNSYPNYGCVNSRPCPTWYYMQVGTAGNIIISISQKGLGPSFTPHDVDFICWGPFPSLTDGCSTGLTGTCPSTGNPCCNNYPPSIPPCVYPKGNITDCSYSGSATETCTILNAQVGEIYVLLLTNFDQQPGTITFSQTGGTGITNCNIVVHCSMVAITADTLPCNPLTNTFSVSGNIEFSNPPITGTLTITDNTAVPPVSQQHFPPFVSPLAYNLANIPCDGATHYLTAVFSDSLNCIRPPQDYVAPEAACPHAYISGGGAICDDGVTHAIVNININGSPIPYNFTYAINGTDQTPVLNYGGPFPYAISTATPGIYTLSSVSNQVCATGGIVSGSATVILNPLPAPTITGPASVCNGTTGVNYTTEPSMTGYLWTISSGGIITAGSGTNSITVTWNTDGAQIVSVSYTDGNGCSPASAVVRNITVNPLPVPTITGLTSVCQGSAGVIYTTEASMTGYYWTISSGGSITAGSGTNSITVTWNLDGAQSLSVNYTNGNGCTASSAMVKNITVNPLPVPSITGSSVVCAGTAGVTYATETFMTGYSWTISPGGIITAGTGTNMITVTWNTVGAQTISVNYINANGCTASAAFVTTVTVNSLPVPTISGLPAVCAGTAGVSYTTEASMTGYTWNISPGGNITAGSGTNTVTVTWNIVGQQTISVNYINANGCTASVASVTNATVNPLPVPSITGSAAVCEGTTGVIYSTESAMTAYTWAISPGGTITAGNGTNSITVTWSTPGTQSISVNYVNSNGCTATSPAVKNININPSPVPTINGPAAVCAGTAGVIYTTEGSMTGYTWTISPGGTITAGNGTKTIIVTWNVAGAKSVSVSYTNALGCSNTTPYSVTIHPLPISTFTTSTPSPVCQEFPTPSLYTVDPGGPSAIYAWQVIPASSAVIVDPTANPASITWKLTGSTPQTAQLTLTATTSGTAPACVSTSTPPVTITINPKPEVTLTSCFDPVTLPSARPFILHGGTPLGPTGIYSGQGVTFTAGQYQFNPASVTGLFPKTVPVTYTYTNNYSCPSSDTKTIIIMDSPQFQCENPMQPLVDIRTALPYKSYNTYWKGNRCWMSENLDYGTEVVYQYPQTDNCQPQKYCPASVPGGCTSGGLYQWDELMQYGSQEGSQGLCPPAWHIPTSLEWQALIDDNQGNGIAGGALKDKDFNAMLTGFSYLNNPWVFTSGSLTATMFWTSTLIGNKPIAHGLNFYNPSVSIYESSKANAFPVRCVKD